MGRDYRSFRLMTRPHTCPHPGIQPAPVPPARSASAATPLVPAVEVLYRAKLAGRNKVVSSDSWLDGDGSSAAKVLNAKKLVAES
jgi:hypothetical protein